MGALTQFGGWSEHAILIAIGFAAILVSIQLIACFPLTLAYEFWKRATLLRLSAVPFHRRVSVLVPAFNEEKTLRACVESLLESLYHDLEIIVVNDGSTDGTERAIDGLVDGVRVRYIYQANAGKATALNRAAVAATGDVLIFTDADSLFLPDTVGDMVRWFADSTIDAVCGNDTPLNCTTPLQKVLAVTSHIGTGFVRRALSMMGVLPIISGNLGAVRARVFREIGGFRQIWGEDLEFTFRLQDARKRIVFDPSPIVRADCPASLRSLWRQRIRWVRSYLKVSVIHSALFVPVRAFPFSIYLPFNYFALTIVPLLQLASIPLLIHFVFARGGRGEWIWIVLFYFGLFTFSIVAVYSILLDRDYKTLKQLPIAMLLILPLSLFYSVVVLSSIWSEILRRDEKWEKIERLPTRVFARQRGLTLAFTGVLLLCTVGVVRLPRNLEPLTSHPSRLPASGLILPAKRQYNSAQVHDVAIATHFDDWQDWHDAVRSVLESSAAPQLRTVGITAGRLEWAHFKWRGHQDQWSSPQRNSSVDMLGTAAGDFKKHGLRTVAIIDLYSPTLVARSQGLAAVRFDGLHSNGQVCFSELVNGEFGQQIIQMVSYLSHNYPIDAIALTEIDYYSFCFDDKCLRSYRETTGQTAWPRKSVSGAINRDDPSIWQWRSTQMQAFLKKVAEAAHSGGKKLIVDVPVSWRDLRRNGRDSGLDYGKVLECADQIVVWNYFGIEGKSPEVSAEVVKDLLQSIPADKFFISVGLWGTPGTLDPQSFQKGLQSSISGGASNIWVTPNELMSSKHWSALEMAVGSARDANAEK